MAALTLAAQNGGAGLFDRVRQTVRTALRYGGVVMVFGTALIFFGAGRLMGLFTDDPEVVAIGAHYLRIAAFIEYAYVLLFVNTSAAAGPEEAGLRPLDRPLPPDRWRRSPSSGPDPGLGPRAVRHLVGHLRHHLVGGPGGGVVGAASGGAV